MIPHSPVLFLQNIFLLLNPASWSTLLTPGSLSLTLHTCIEGTSTVSGKYPLGDVGVTWQTVLNTVNSPQIIW